MQKKKKMIVFWVVMGAVAAGYAYLLAKTMKTAPPFQTGDCR
jgi:hypothetical protein